VKTSLVLALFFVIDFAHQRQLQQRQSTDHLRVGKAIVELGCGADFSLSSPVRCGVLGRSSCRSGKSLPERWQTQQAVQRREYDGVLVPPFCSMGRLSVSVLLDLPLYGRRALLPNYEISNSRDCRLIDYRSDRLVVLSSPESE
jgi:hypothetical protein